MFAALGSVFEGHVSLRETVMRLGEILRIHREQRLVLDERFSRAAGGREPVTELEMHLRTQRRHHQDVPEHVDRIVASPGLTERTRQRDQRVGIVAAAAPVLEQRIGAERRLAEIAMRSFWKFFMMA